MDSYIEFTEQKEVALAQLVEMVGQSKSGTFNYIAFLASTTTNEAYDAIKTRPSTVDPRARDLAKHIQTLDE